LGSRGRCRYRLPITVSRGGSTSFERHPGVIRAITNADPFFASAHLRTSNRLQSTEVSAGTEKVLPLFHGTHPPALDCLLFSREGSCVCCLLPFCFFVRACMWTWPGPATTNLSATASETARKFACVAGGGAAGLLKTRWPPVGEIIDLQPNQAPSSGVYLGHIGGSWRKNATAGQSATNSSVPWYLKFVIRNSLRRGCTLQTPRYSTRGSASGSKGGCGEQRACGLRIAVQDNPQFQALLVGPPSDHHPSTDTQTHTQTIRFVLKDMEGAMRNGDGEWRGQTSGGCHIKSTEGRATNTGFRCGRQRANGRRRQRPPPTHPPGCCCMRKFSANELRNPVKRA
jgi:hypothetical protein